MFWNELDTDTKARLIRDGLRMGLKRWERVRDAYEKQLEKVVIQRRFDGGGNPVLENIF
jgi:hypothetical protein